MNKYEPLILLKEREQESSIRVRLRFGPDKFWYVESKQWWSFGWNYEKLFGGDDAYERAHFYARALKFPYIEEIT
jgi:hypothetical protein